MSSIQHIFFRKGLPIFLSAHGHRYTTWICVCPFVRFFVPKHSHLNWCLRSSTIPNIPKSSLLGTWIMPMKLKIFLWACYPGALTNWSGAKTKEMEGGCQLSHFWGPRDGRPHHLPMRGCSLRLGLLQRNLGVGQESHELWWSFWTLDPFRVQGV